MSNGNSDSERSNLGLPEMQDAQRQHDFEFHPDLEKLTIDRQIAHVIFHLNKVVGHFGNYLEKKDHGDQEVAERLLADLKSKWGPDILIYALKMANLLQIDLEEAAAVRVSQDRVVQSAKLAKK